jgi:hypothetical protein
MAGEVTVLKADYNQSIRLPDSGAKRRINESLYHRRPGRYDLERIHLPAAGTL